MGLQIKKRHLADKQNWEQKSNGRNITTDIRITPRLLEKREITSTWKYSKQIPSN